MIARPVGADLGRDGPTALCLIHRSAPIATKVGSYGGVVQM